MNTTVIENQEKQSVWDSTLILIDEIYREVRSFNDYHFGNEIRRVSLTISTSLFKGLKEPYGLEYLSALAVANGACYELNELIIKAVSKNDMERSIASRMLIRIKKLARELFELARCR